MATKEYEQKRRECWEQYKRENLDGEVQWQPVSRYEVFCAAFDRAYALGKHEFKQEIKQETKQEIKQEIKQAPVINLSETNARLHLKSDVPHKNN